MATKTTKQQPMHQNTIDGYVGLYAHTFNDEGRVQYQLKVVHQIPDGRLICQMFSFLSGEPTNQQTFTIEETKGWQFYTTAEDWMFGYQWHEKAWRK